MTISRITAVALAPAASLGVAACGSSSSSSTTTSTSGGAASTSTSTSSGGGGSASVSGAGSTFAAPIYQQWGSIAFGGITLSYKKQLDYASLPAPLLAKDRAQLKKLTCNGSPLS